MIKGIGHVAYVVKDLEESLHFYCDILGFEELFTMKDDQGDPVLTYLKVQRNQFIELFPAQKGDKKQSARIGYGHLCLEVEDINEIARVMKEKGIKMDVEPKKGNDGNFQCWIHDPDGNRIEFMQMMPDSLQMKNSL